MIARFQSFLEQEELLFPDDHIFLALSGGLDSMAMLFMFCHIRRDYHLTLQAVHVNHGLRGRESDLDQALVEQVCRKEEIPLTVRRLNGFTLSHGEDVLREARYTIFTELLQTHPGYKIATAHHRDDQLETQLMRLAKGSYLEGLQGIPAQRPGFIRPLLPFKRSELEAFVQEHNIPFREDDSNRDMNKLRNRIRHRLIPELVAVFGEQVHDHLNKSFSHLREVNEYIILQENQWRQKYLERKPQQIAFTQTAYAQLPLWLRRRLLRYCISALIPVTLRLSKDSFNGFERFAQNGQNGAFFYFPSGVSVLKDRGRFLFRISEKRSVAEKELSQTGSVCMGRNILSVKRVERQEVRFTLRPDSEYICGDTLHWPLKIRYWRKGDYFYPLGAAGRQKLHKFFIDHKIDRWQKQAIPLVCNGDDIIWLAGIRLDARYKVNAGCRTIYRLSIKSIDDEEKNEL